MRVSVIREGACFYKAAAFAFLTFIGRSAALIPLHFLRLCLSFFFFRTPLLALRVLLVDTQIYPLFVVGGGRKRWERTRTFQYPWATRRSNHPHILETRRMEIITVMMSTYSADIQTEQCAGRTRISNPASVCFERQRSAVSAQLSGCRKVSPLLTASSSSNLSPVSPPFANIRNPLRYHPLSTQWPPFHHRHPS